MSKNQLTAHSENISKEELSKVDMLAEYVGMLFTPSDFIEAFEKTKNTKTKIDETAILKALDLLKIKDCRYQKKCVNMIKKINEDSKLLTLYHVFFHSLYTGEKRCLDILSFKLNTESIFCKENLFLNDIVCLAGLETFTKIARENNYSKTIIQNTFKSVKKSLSFKKNQTGLQFKTLNLNSKWLRGELIQIGSLVYELCVDFIAIWILGEEFTPKNKREFFVNIHVKPGIKFSQQAILKSLKHANNNLFKYFKKTYSLKNRKMINDNYMCCSWLLNEELQEILDKNSNITAFQKMFTAKKQENDKAPYLFNIFGVSRNFTDFQSLKTKNKLQEKIKEKLIKSEPLFITSGILNIKELFPKKK